MICDELGVPLEKGQVVAFYWAGPPQFVGKVSEVKEIVVGPKQQRYVRIVCTHDFPIPPEAGPHPQIPGVYVTAAQDKKASMVEKPS